MTTPINRRTFNRGLLFAGSASLGLLGLAGCEKKSAPAKKEPSATNPQELGELVAGIDYKVLQNPVPTNAPEGKAAMLEFFGYWCPHCQTLAPEVEKWREHAPQSIDFEMVPVNFGSNAHDALQRLFYALRDVNKVDAMHLKVFEAIHQQKVPMSTREDILNWVNKQPELEGTNFEQAYDSFSMDQNINRAQQLINAYQVEGSPSFGIAGKYYVDGTLARGLTRSLLIAEKLAIETTQKTS